MFIALKDAYLGLLYSGQKACWTELEQKEKNLAVHAQKVVADPTKIGEIKGLEFYIEARELKTMHENWAKYKRPVVNCVYS